MNLITDTWRGLVRRKLWPVALLLVAALVAVPLTLAKEPEVVPVAANAGASAADELPATFVTAATDTEEIEGTTSKRRRTLGAAKDPFEPAPLPKAKKKKSKKTTAKASESTTEKETTKDSGSTPSSGGGGGGTTAPTAPVATATPTATPKPDPARSVRVRFSRVEEGSDETDPMLVEKLEVLPDDENPVIVFQGLENKGKVAVFELTGTVTVEGDGECDPTPEACQFVRLRAGETVFVTVADTGETTDAQYQLDLVKINR